MLVMQKREVRTEIRTKKVNLKLMRLSKKHKSLVLLHKHPDDT